MNYTNLIGTLFAIGAITACTTVIDPKKPTVDAQEVRPVLTQPAMIARLTDRKSKGLYIYEVTLQASQGIQTIEMISGRPWRQDSNEEHIADIGSPLPLGTYSVNPTIQDAPLSKFGGFFVSIEPNFNTPRYDLGLHHDQEFNQGGSELGTMGCLATINENDRKTLINFIASQKPEIMVVY